MNPAIVGILKENGLSLIAEMDALLAKHGIQGNIQCFFISNQPAFVAAAQDNTNPEKCGFCCWSVGPSTLGCGICCDF